MIELSTIRDLVAIFGVIAGFSYYVLTVRANQRNQELTLKSQKHATDTREAQLFLNLMNTFTTPENVKIQDEILFNWTYTDFEDWLQKYGPETNPDAFALFDSTCSQLEAMGVLVRHGLINPEILKDMISGHVTGMWEKYEPIIQAFREHYNFPQAFGQFEYLYNQIKPISESTPNVNR